MPGTHICLSDVCREKKQQGEELPPIILNKGDKKVCPTCGESHTLYKIAIIHLVVRDPKGPLKGSGGSYRYVCPAAQKTPPKHHTNHRPAANCPECLELTRDMEEDGEETTAATQGVEQ